MNMLKRILGYFVCGTFLAFAYHQTILSRRLNVHSKTPSTLTATLIEPPSKVQNDNDGQLPIVPKDIFDWQKQWYPVAAVDYIDATRPNKFMLLGHDIVLWNDGTGWIAFKDSCPHRGVPLSKILISLKLLLIY